MFKETDRNGERVAKRDCFKSFIGPPSRLDVCGSQKSYAL
jgi:hypothetical protein